MLNNAKIFLYNKRTWVYFLQYVLLSLVLLTAVLLVDTSDTIDHRYLPEVFFTSAESAQSVLSSLSSALLSIATFTFTTIISVLTFYSSSFTPRVVENFASKKITMKVLGAFIGGFIYSIIALNFTKTYNSETPVIAGNIGVLYGLLCVLYLTIFFQETIKSLQVTNLITEISDITSKVIDEDLKDRDREYNVKDLENSQYISVLSNKSGYLEAINYTEAGDIFKNFSGLVYLSHKRGEFIVELEELARIYTKKDSELINDKVIKEIYDFFHIQENKISITDYRYGLDKLTEITITALSSDVRDPSTATHCIRKLSLLMSKLSKVDSNHYVKNIGDKGLIYYFTQSFEQDFYDTFVHIYNHAGETSEIMNTLYDAFIILVTSASDKNKAFLAEVVQDMHENIIDKFNLTCDRENFEKKYQRFSAIASR